MGRCAGCGRTGSLRAIRIHITECPDYLARFRDDPAGAPDPASDFARHRDQRRDPQQRARQRDVRLTARFAEINRQQAVSASRWATPPDLLD